MNSLHVLVLVFWTYCLVLAEALKECMEPIRSSTRDAWTCNAEFGAMVPETIVHNQHGSQKDNNQDCPSHDTSDPAAKDDTSSGEGSEVCAFVSEAMFAEWRMLDGALWTSGSCKADIRAGNFTAQDAWNVFPENHELIGVRIQGRDLLQVIEDGLVQYYIHGNKDAYPHTAGLKYTLDLLQPKGQRIQKAKLLGFYCDWKPLNENESYMIMTNNNIANTLFSSVPKHNKTPSKRGETEALFFYALSVCNVKSNWHRMRLHHDPKQIPLPSDMILDSSTTCSERTTSATV